MKKSMSSLWTKFSWIGRLYEGDVLYRCGFCGLILKVLSGVLIYGTVELQWIGVQGTSHLN